MIRRYTVTDNRTLVSPWFNGTAENNYRDSRPAEYAEPFVGRAEVVAAFERGETVPGYDVTVSVIGVGTTVRVGWESVSRGWDDWDSVLRATYRDEAGEWRTENVAWDRADAGNTATEDASTEVRAAYQAHLAAIAEARRVEDQRIAAEKRAEEERAYRATPERGKFVRVARGRKVPIGAVGRVFWQGVSNGMYPTSKVGLAASTRTERDERSGRDRAADAVFVAESNCDVLLQETPADARELAALYVFADAVAAHIPAYAPEVFPSEWALDYAEEWRLVVADAYSPAEMPRLDAKTTRTLDEVMDAVCSVSDAIDALRLIASGRVEAYRATHNTGDVEAWRTEARKVIEGCLVVVCRPRKRAAKKATATV